MKPSKLNREFKKTYAQIIKNINKIKWDCAIDNCQEKAINSHYLQNNGILNTVAKNDHVIDLQLV